MAHFARIRSVGTWTVSSTVLSAEFESFDTNLYKAVNGDDGGTWAPSSAIVLGGHGLEINSAPLVLDTAAVTWTGGTTVFSSPHWDGTILLDGTLRWDVDDGVAKLFTLGNYISVVFKDGSDTTTASLNGSTFSLTLPVAINSGGSITINTGASLTFKGTTKPTLQSRSVTRIQNTTPQTASSGDWEESIGKFVTKNTAAGGGELWIPIRVPHGATLTGASVTFKPSTGHGGSLPGTLPTLRIVKLSGGTYTNISSTVSDSTAAASYETVHSIAVSGLSESIDRTAAQYFAVFTNEGPSNMSTPLEYYSTAVTFNATSIDED